MLEQSQKTALPDLLQFLRGMGQLNGSDSTSTDQPASGPSFQDLLNQALQGASQDDAYPIESTATPVAERRFEPVTAKRTDVTTEPAVADPALQPRHFTPDALVHQAKAAHDTKAADKKDAHPTAAKTKLDHEHAAAPGAKEAPKVHLPVNQVLPQHQTLPPLPTNQTTTPVKTTSVKPVPAKTAEIHPVAPHDAKPQTVTPAKAKDEKAEAHSRTGAGRTGLAQPEEGKGQEAAQRMLAAAKNAPTDTPHTVQDALRLINDIAKKLGVKDADQRLGRDEKIGKSDDKKSTKLELVRNELKLQPRDAQFRVEVVQANPANQAPNNQLQKDLAAQYAQYSPQLRADEGLKPAKEVTFYNPASAQAVIHHSIDLPGGVPQTVANLTRTLQTHLRENLNGNMVGQAKILLSGNESGEIRLVLHPEQLGEVRIHLKLADNAIGGTIYVDDKNVLQVFKDNMADLQQAFRDGGLDASQLQLAVFDGRGDNASGGGQDRNRDDQSFVKYAQETLASSVPQVAAYASASSLIDLVV